MGAEGADSSSGAFEAELAALKRDGCNLLVAGPAVDDLHARVCREMLGDPAAGSRRHLFVLPGGSPAVGAGPTGDRDCAVVAGDSDRRRATAPDGAWRVETSDADALAGAVTDEIARIDDEAGGLDPAELRVCVDAVSGLRAQHRGEALREFLDAVTDSVSAVAGLGHYHCAGDPDGGVEGPADAFDVSVELRADERPRQRWHLHDADLSSEWLPL